jgi:chemotaxis protein methyltransferase CheR
LRPGPLRTGNGELKVELMHRLMPGVTILEHELSELRLLVERQIGILLDCPNSALAAHVADYLEKQELDSPAALLDRVRAADQEPGFLPQFLGGVLNTTTGFFRHPGAMNALAQYVVPQLCTRKTEEPATVRIWSAGCGTGEEAYSIAMAICESLVNGSGNSNGSGFAGGNGSKEGKISASRNGNGGVAPCTVTSAKDWSIHIVGTDLLPSSIRAAERGLYPQSALAGLPPTMIRASFSKIGNGNGQNVADALKSSSESSGPSGGSNAASNGNSAVPTNGNAHLLVKPRLRSLVTFNTMNLTRPVYIGRFDCIFCMDVLPHLSRSQRSALIERLHLYLEPGGYLFLSQTEKLCAPNLNFRPEVFDGYTMHRKPLAASAAYGR